jgi:hypothetical protein
MMHRQRVAHKRDFIALATSMARLIFIAYVTALGSIRIANHKWLGLYVAATALLPYKESAAQDHHLSAVAGIIAL